MKILDLVNQDNSDIKYVINSYPDGQKDVIITDNNISSTTYIKNGGIVRIKARLNNMEDLGLIICATKALRNLGSKEIHLYTPYIMGLRSDRLFKEGGVRYIKDVLAPILNNLNFESVTCFDAHSYVAENCINNLKVIDNKQLVGFALKDIYTKPLVDSVSTYNNFILISPDAGASHKIYKLAEKIGYKGDIITCSKERDTEGNLSKTIVPIKDNIISFQKDKIIIDDICDGGATFINIAKKLRDLKHDDKIYLIVTHGIFSKGLLELGEYFDGIYCTNSYQDLEPENDGSDYIYPDLVTELNVF